MYVEYIDILNKVLDDLKLNNISFNYDQTGMDTFTNKVLEVPNLSENFRNFTIELNNKFKMLL